MKVIYLKQKAKQKLRAVVPKPG